MIVNMFILIYSVFEWHFKAFVWNFNTLKQSVLALN